MHTYSWVRNNTDNPTHATSITYRIPHNFQFRFLINRVRSYEKLHSSFFASRIRTSSYQSLKKNVLFKIDIAHTHTHTHIYIYIYISPQQINPFLPGFLYLQSIDKRRAKDSLWDRGMPYPMRVHGQISIPLLSLSCYKQYYAIYTRRYIYTLI